MPIYIGYLYCFVYYCVCSFLCLVIGCDFESESFCSYCFFEFVWWILSNSFFLCLLLSSFVETCCIYFFPYCVVYLEINCCYWLMFFLRYLLVLWVEIYCNFFLIGFLLMSWDGCSRSLLSSFLMECLYF